MEIIIDNKGKSLYDISVVADQEKWKEAQKAELEKAAENIEIDGFRKGKAPLSKVKQHVNEFDIMEKAANSLLNDMFVAGLEKAEIFPAAQPMVNIEVITPDELKVKFEVAIKPEFELKEYKGFSADKDAPVVEDAEVEQQIEMLLNQHVDLQLVDRAAQEGDAVIIDFEGFVDGTPFDGGKAEGYTLELGSGSFIPGFEEQLVGTKSGDEVDVKVTFPEEYQAAELAGKEAVFKVNVHEVKEKKANELNDEFVASLAIPEVTTVAELKEDISNRMLEHKQAEVDNQYIGEIMKQIADTVEMDIPEMMIAQEIDASYNQLLQNLSQQGLNEELFLQINNKTKEEIKEDLREDAIRKIKFSLIIEKIADLEEIEISDAELDAKLAEMAAMYNMEVEQIKQMLPDVEAIRYEQRMNKAIEFIKENSK